MGGEKEILGFYIGDAESAKYWCNILNELRNRGVKGLKDAIGNISTMTEFQRCIVHIIRNTLQYMSYKDRKELAKDLKQIYRAATQEITYSNLMELNEKWKARRVFPTVQSLEKSMYLSTNYSIYSFYNIK